MSGVATSVVFAGEPDEADSIADRIGERCDRATIEAATETAAVAEAVEAGADCVVCARRVADGDWRAVLSTVRERDPHLPFVLVPADGDESLASEALAAGATDYVPREDGAVPVEALTERVDAAVDRRSGRRGPAARDEEVQTVLDRVSDGFYALDDDWRFTYVNERAEELLLFDADDLVGELIWDVFPDVAEGRVREKYERAMETQQPVNFEYHYEPLNLWVEVTAYPSESGLSVYFRDVSERFEREQELAVTNQRYETLVEHIPDGAVALFDDDLRFRIAGGDALADIERSAGELEGRPVYEALPDGVAEELVPHAQAVLDGESREFQHTFGGTVYDVRAVPVHDERGDVTGGMVILRDVTEREQRERELEARRERLEALNELDSLVHGLAEAVVKQSDREEIEALVCEQLADSASYDFAWIGSVDDDRGRFVPHVQAGDEAFVADLPGDAEWLDAEEGPAARALLSGDVQVVDAAAVAGDGGGESASDPAEGVTGDGETVASGAEGVAGRGEAVPGGSEPAAGSGSRPPSGAGRRAGEGAGATGEGTGATGERAGRRAVEARDRDRGAARENRSGADARPGPAGADENAVAVARDAYEAAWLDRVRASGYRSAALVPITHEGNAYGVLHVAADRADAFGRQERAAFERLGTVIAHAIRSLERLRKLRENEQRYRTLAENVPNGTVALVDEDLRYRLAAGENFERMDVSPEDLTGTRVSAVEALPEEVTRRQEAAFQRALAGETVSMELEYGGRVYEFQALPIERDGEVSGAMSLSQDVTERVQRETDLEHERERLELLNRLIRHNLLNSLNVVDARLEMVEGHVEGSQDKHLDTARDRTGEMIDLIETIRTLMRAIDDDEDQPLEPVPVDRRLRREVSAAADAYPDASFEVADLPSVAVAADELLSEVFENLLVNAVQHNDTDEPQVWVDAWTEDGEVVVEVADDGPGVPEDLREQIFRKGTTGFESPGTGFGLHLVREIVDAYGGDVTVEDNEPRGARFLVRLPLA